MSLSEADDVMAAYFGHPDSQPLAGSFAATLGITKSFVKEYYPEAQAVFLFGSYRNGEVRTFSDVDLLIVEEASRLNCAKRYSYKSMHLEAHVFSADAIIVGLRHAYRTGRTNVVFGINDSVIISDTGKIAFRLQSAVKRVIEEGPSELSSAEFNRIYRAIILGLRDIHINPSFDERFASIITIQPLIIGLHAASKRRWIKGGKWAVRDAPGFVTMLNLELQEALASRSISRLLAMLEGLITQWPTPTWNGSDEMAAPHLSSRI